MTSNSKISIILKLEENWSEWIEIVETVARKNDIWEYTNLELSKDELLKLRAPKEPEFKDMHQGPPRQPVPEGQEAPGVELMDLSATETQHYTCLMSHYTQKEKKYQTKRAQLRI